MKPSISLSQFQVWSACWEAHFKLFSFELGFWLFSDMSAMNSLSKVVGILFGFSSKGICPLFYYKNQQCTADNASKMFINVCNLLQILTEQIQKRLLSTQHRRHCEVYWCLFVCRYVLKIFRKWMEVICGHSTNKSQISKNVHIWHVLSYFYSLTYSFITEWNYMRSKGDIWIVWELIFICPPCFLLLAKIEPMLIFTHRPLVI